MSFEDYEIHLSNPRTKAHISLAQSSKVNALIKTNLGTRVLTDLIVDDDFLEGSNGHEIQQCEAMNKMDLQTSKTPNVISQISTNFGISAMMDPIGEE